MTCRRFPKDGWIGLIFLLVFVFISGCGKNGLVSLPNVTNISSIAKTAQPENITDQNQKTESIGSASSGITTSTQEPAAILPVIDGIISPNEWEDATVESFADGSELLLFQRDGFLFIGIRANTPEMIAGNVFIASGNKIKILHTSAALGTAIYEKNGEVWQQTQGFDWCCRETFNSEAAEAARAAFFEGEGWLAINSRNGTPNELEYQIVLDGESFQLAVNFLRVSETDKKPPFPVGLDDDCVRPTPGQYPTEMQFSPDKWVQMVGGN